MDNPEFNDIRLERPLRVGDFVQIKGKIMENSTYQILFVHTYTYTSAESNFWKFLVLMKFAELVLMNIDIDLKNNLTKYYYHYHNPGEGYTKGWVKNFIF